MTILTILLRDVLHTYHTIIYCNLLNDSYSVGSQNKIIIILC